MVTQRNDPCPCGSGRKFKRCCYGADVAATPAETLRNGRGALGTRSCTRARPPRRGAVFVTRGAAR
ncbi:MAG: SEC-C domain-containing protein [Proteobacteria bacterium]|nr:SEC-C domain-containing protein [Pseudomonadota bacterium]